MTEQEQRVRDELAKIYPQLVINAQKTCGNGYEKWGDDLLAMCILIYLEKPIQQQIKIIDDGKLENYITYIMGFQLKLGTTAFFHTYRKHSARSNEIGDWHAKKTYNLAFEDEPDPCAECIKQEIDKLDPYLKMLVNEKVIENETYSAISRKYDINYHHLKKDTQEILKQIQKTCKHLRQYH